MCSRREGGREGGGREEIVWLLDKEVEEGKEGGREGGQTEIYIYKEYVEERKTMTWQVTVVSASY